LSNENKDKDMKKKVTVVGAIALSAVLASGVGYTSYNLLNDKNNVEEIGEEVVKQIDENDKVISNKLEVITMKEKDEIDDIVATAIKNEEPGLSLFDDQDDYSDLDNSIANADKHHVKDLAIFEEDEDEFQDLNDSLVAVAVEERNGGAENDVAILEPVIVEPVEIAIPNEEPEQFDEPTEPILTEKPVDKVTPSEPVLPSKPSEAEGYSMIFSWSASKEATSKAISLESVCNSFNWLISFFAIKKLTIDLSKSGTLSNAFCALFDIKYVNNAAFRSSFSSVSKSSLSKCSTASEYF